MSKTVAIVQARLASTRLPNKVLLDLCGKPVVQHVVERVSAANEVDEVIVATSDQPDDAELVECLNEAAIPVYCGPAEDVLERYWLAARKCGARTIVRITADCPLIDPGIVDRVVRFCQTENYDYACNVEPHRTFPRGLDTEVFSREALDRLRREAKLKRDREHVTTYVRFTNPQGFRTGVLTHAVDYSHLRWTLDEPADFRFISAVYRELYDPSRLFTWQEVLDLLRRKPELSDLNRDVAQKPIEPD